MMISFWNIIKLKKYNLFIIMYSWRIVESLFKMWSSLYITKYFSMDQVLCIILCLWKWPSLCKNLRSFNGNFKQIKPSGICCKVDLPNHGVTEFDHGLFLPCWKWQLKDLKKSTKACQALKILSRDINVKAGSISFLIDIDVCTVCVCWVLDVHFIPTLYTTIVL